MKKILTAFVAALALALAPLVPASGLGFQPVGVDTSTGQQGVFIRDATSGPRVMSIVHDRDQVDVNGFNPFCTTPTSETCGLGPNDRLSITTLLPVCTTVEENCIESLRIYRVGEPVSEAKFVKEVAGLTFAAVESKGIPRGATPSIWAAPSIKNLSGSDKYSANVGLNMQWMNGKIQNVNLSAAVFSVNEIAGSNFKPSYVHFHEVNGKTINNLDNGEQGGRDLCSATDTNYCAEIADLPEGVRIGITLRITNQVIGWLHGRITKPEISITKIDSKFNRLVLDANPVVVPQFYAVVKPKELPSNIQSWLKGYESGGGINGSNATWTNYGSGASQGVILTSALSKYANDTAAGSVNQWKFSSIASRDVGNRCLDDKSQLVGLVTTNSLAYSGTVPAYKNGFLDYMVGGLHYMPDGKTLAEGTYDLAIRSSTARCLYGFSKAPVSASISVTGSAGEKKVATTTVSEKNGWLRLAAYGFTFSSPKIRVKLSQKKR